MKNNSTIYYDIFKICRTVQETQDVIEELDQLHSSFYQENQGDLAQKLSLLRPTTAAAVKAYFSKSKVTLDDQDKIKDLLFSAKQALQKRHVLSLAVVFVPTASAIEKIYNWTMLNLGQNVVLSFSADQSLQGGVVINYKGKYIDMSLETLVYEVLASKRSMLFPSASTQQAGERATKK